MHVLDIIDEDFVNFKIPSMTISMPYCDFKCDQDAGCIVCHNHNLADLPILNIHTSTIVARYINNPITKAITVQGLEPFYVNHPQAKDSYTEVLNFIKVLRSTYGVKDPVVIFTGYTEDECTEQGFLTPFTTNEYLSNVIIKFGRYIPDQDPHLDPLLGIKLSSDNQYAKQIS